MCNLFILILFYDIVVNKISQLFLVIITNNAITYRNINITKNCVYIIGYFNFIYLNAWHGYTIILTQCV